MNNEAQMEKIATKMLEACAGQNSSYAAGAALSVFRTICNYGDNEFRKVSVEFLREAADLMELQYGLVDKH